VEATPARGWKFYVGVALLVYSCAMWPLAALVPFFFSALVAATVATALVVSGEIAFLISVVLLGKPFILALKARLKSWFGRGREPAPSDPAS
jgi:hypothetical protein